MQVRPQNDVEILLGALSRLTVEYESTLADAYWMHCSAPPQLMADTVRSIAAAANAVRNLGVWYRRGSCPGHYDSGVDVNIETRVLASDRKTRGKLPNSNYLEYTIDSTVEGAQIIRSNPITDATMEALMVSPFPGEDHRSCDTFPSERYEFSDGAYRYRDQSWLKDMWVVRQGEDVVD